MGYSTHETGFLLATGNKLAMDPLKFSLTVKYETDFHWLKVMESMESLLNHIVAQVRGNLIECRK